MGCSSSSNAHSAKKKKKLKEIKFDHVGVYSLDDFLSKAKATIDEFGDLLEPVESAMENFINVTDFWKEKHASKSSSISSYFTHRH